MTAQTPDRTLDRASLTSQTESQRLQVQWTSPIVLTVATVVVVASALLARPTGRVTYTFEFLSFVYLGLAVATLVFDRRSRGHLHPATPLIVGLTAMSLFECLFDTAVYVIYDTEFRFMTPEIFPF